VYCSGPAISRLAEKAGLGNISAEDVVAEANAGNIQAEAVLTEATRYLAIGVLNTLRVYDPDVLVIGGGLASVMTSRVKPMLSDIQWKIHDDRRNIPIVIAACEDPGVQGAAALAFKGETSIQSSPLLRRALESDRLFLYSVCLRTGDSGQDGSHLFNDPHLLGSIYVGPYLSFSKQFSFCLVNSVGVGYVLGVLDTRSFEKVCEEHWWPQIRDKYPLKNLEKYRENERELILSQIHSRPQLDVDLVENYPSHLHIDLMPDVQGKGYGVVMVNRLLYALTEAGSIGVHLTMHKDNRRAFSFYEKMGFKLVKELPLTNEKILARSLP
jgi:GNAT superfamily N-acetyltransferase